MEIWNRWVETTWREWKRFIFPQIHISPIFQVISHYKFADFLDLVRKNCFLKNSIIPLQGLTQESELDKNGEKRWNFAKCFRRQAWFIGWNYAICRQRQIHTEITNCQLLSWPTDISTSYFFCATIISLQGSSNQQKFSPFLTNFFTDDYSVH